MRRSIVTLVLLVSACSPAGTAVSTTAPTVLSSTSTAESLTTTSSVASTTPTTMPPTTMPPTTTTTAPSTSTTAGREGNWASQPLVTVGFGALGWWDGSGWVDAESAGALPVVGGEDYQTVRLDQIGMTTGGEEAIVCEPLGLMGVDLEDPQLLGDFPGPYGIAISAPWDLQPHLFEEIADDGTYAGFAAGLLSERGLDVADPVVKQLFRTDLEGDGVNEVLVVAEEVPQNFLMEPGNYSITFMRKVIDGEVQTAVILETVAMDDEDTFGGAHSFGGVADLNNDGKMELIASSAFFEGFTISVWEYVNDDLGAVKALEAVCGV